MGKEDQIIMVIKRNKLFGREPFQGFRPQNEVDYERRILENLEFMRRGDAEENPSMKQPIAYCLIINPASQLIYAYQRASEEYDESRLRGKWSLGVGGHIELVDGTGNPIHRSMLRELREEVEIGKEIETRVLGYVNDDSNDVGKVHFGILYLVKTNSDSVYPREKESARGELVTVGRLEEISNSPDCELENWSQISLNPLRRRVLYEEIVPVGFSAFDRSAALNGSRILVGERGEDEVFFRYSDQEPTGMSFEPRSTRTFAILVGNLRVGEYKETVVYGKNCEIEICRFGLAQAA